MYSRQEMAQLRESFWTSFGQYMAPVPSAAGQKINWVNYKTGVKDLYVKMQAAQESASIAIVLTHAQPEKQASIYDQLLQLKNLLRDALQEEWQWQQQVKDENNKTISAVYTSINGVNIYRKEDWPAIISFFKPRMVALDAFWTEVKEGFMYL
jgi:Zn-dependent metalloprotease